MKILLVAILALNSAAESCLNLKRGFESAGFKIANDLGPLENTIDLSKECGIRAEKPKARIEGGEEVIPHSIPWQVHLGNCGGTLISPRHVLTAAHCINHPHEPERLSVGVGMHNITAKDGKEIAVRHIAIPEDYSRYDENGHEHLDNDFALLTLATPVALNDKIRIACLPSERLGGNFLVDKNLTVSGWGIGSGDILKQVQIPGISNKYCQELYNETTEDEESCFKGWFPKITENMLCAGIPYPNTKAPARGDSGGPLTYNDNGRETLVGVVSYGDKTCSSSSLVDGSVHVYARVTEKLEWIKNEMEKN